MKIHKGIRYFDPPQLENIRDIIVQGKEKFADRIAVRYRNNPDDKVIQEVTYEQFYNDVRGLVQGLMSLGLYNVRVAVLGDNSYSWMLAYMAAVSGLGVVVPLDRLLTGNELSVLLQRGDVDLLFVDGTMMEELRPYLKDCPKVKHIVGMERQRLRKQEQAKAFQEEVRGLGGQYHELQDLIGAGRVLQETGQAKEGYFPQTDEMAVLLFTSGTTAAAKAVMLSNKNIIADVKALLMTVKFKDPLTSLSLLPLHHTFVNTCGFLSVLALGGCIHVYDGLRYIAKNIKEYQVQMVIGVPKVFEMIHRKVTSGIKKQGKERIFNVMRFISNALLKVGIDQRRFFFKDVLDQLGGEFHVAISGAANLDKEVILFFRDIGIDILQGYGLTECSPVVGGCNTQYNVPGTCGQPLAGIEMTIDSDDLSEPGEILVRGDIVMLGYYQNEEASKEVLQEDGWFRTGDIGHFDPETNCLILSGRTKFMIVLPSGKKVFPEEVESLLNQNEFIKESLVFGQEEENGNIVLMAKLVIDKEALDKEGIDEASPSLRKSIDDYIEQINESLPSFKGIRSYVYTFEEMVKTTSMKIRRGLENEKMKDFLQKSPLNWKEMLGQNLDELLKGKVPTSEEQNEDMSKEETKESEENEE